MWRQGDIFIRAIRSIPREAVSRPLPHTVLAHGSQPQQPRASLPAPALKAVVMPPVVPAPRQLSAAEVERIEADYAVLVMLKARRLALGQME